MLLLKGVHTGAQKLSNSLFSDARVQELLSYLLKALSSDLGIPNVLHLPSIVAQKLFLFMIKSAIHFLTVNGHDPVHLSGLQGLVFGHRG